MGNIAQKTTFFVDLDEDCAHAAGPAEYMRLQDSSSVETTLSTTPERDRISTKDSLNTQSSGLSSHLSSDSVMPSGNSQKSGISSIQSQSIQLHSVHYDSTVAKTPNASESDSEMFAALSSATGSTMASTSSQDIMSQSASSDIFAVSIYSPLCISHSRMRIGSCRHRHHAARSLSAAIWLLQLLCHPISK